MILLYGLLQVLLSPLWVPWMWLRVRRRGGAMNWAERYGNYAFTLDRTKARLWFHAVSVGEVIASKPILEAVRRLRPDAEILLTVTTTSGHQVAKEQLGDLVDHIAYVPIDIGRFVLAALTRVRPHVVAIMETELWPNLLYYSHQFRARTVLVNGRISDRSFGRSQKFGFFYRAVLQYLDECLMQTAQDAERIRALGGGQVRVMGNSKFDQAAPTGRSRSEWRAEFGWTEADFVIVVGSTRSADEERILLDALAPLRAEVKVVFAPRHLERSDEVALAASASGTVARRSKAELGPFVLLDTYGELSSVYAAADVSIIGGSFASHGGQNLIQALGHGVPVLHGPWMENFASAAREAADAGASRKLEATPAAVREAIQMLRADPDLRHKMGAAGKALVESAQGASARYAEAICAAMPPTTGEPC